jgi:cysteine desulfurase / selenocysteine lyase
MANNLDINKIRAEFPILSLQVYGKPLVYLDNAATTQKPQIVIDTLKNYYETMNSNIHRGVHYLSEKATNKYEETRKIVKNFINAERVEEIIFTRGTTESLNLFATSFGKAFINEGDEIIISTMEHHSNIVPWQILCQDRKCKLRVIPINDEGEIIYEEFEKMINEKTKLVSIVHVSNSLGTINPIEDIIKKAHSYNIPVMIDMAQSIQHFKVDVRALDCDFIAFSGHKIYGPTGIGILYGKKKYLDQMPPYQGGGDMILSVSFEKTLYNSLPYKFEAGTPNIAGAIGLGEAIKYIESIGLDEIVSYESKLLDYAAEQVSDIKELTIIGRAKAKASVLSFVLDNIHPHDIGTLIDREGVAIRTGHHCTEPVMRRYNLPATSRASFSFYNTMQEVDVLVMTIRKVIKMFS